MEFYRKSGNGVSYNADGDIYLTDMVMNGNSDWEVGYALHEIGHNWDNHATDQESSIETEFLALSGWKQTNPHSTAYTRINMYSETWWYTTNEDFTSTYAKTHPSDDFAESFAAYFLDLAGLPWYSSDGHGAIDIPDKIQLIDNWVTSL